MRTQPQHYLDLPNFYQRKRDLFNQLMANSRFEGLSTAGSYFQVLDYSRISDKADMAFCEQLTKDVGVAAIPLSVFCKTPPDMKLVRFCFAKSDQILEAACEKLKVL
jgi:methionine aminotransferase